MDQEVKLMNKVIQQQNYNVIAKLSEGSYGQIFLVQNKETQKKYVLKALQIEKLKRQSKIHQAFIQSIILRKLAHPGIIKLFQTIQRQNYFSQVLEFCPNQDLFKLMAKVNHDLSLLKKKKEIMHFYLAQILQSISYLHRNKIIHRDLKPQNIVITENLHTKIIDFGTALVNNQQYLSQIQKQSYQALKNSEKQLVGSAHYLSPQALKFQYSQKSDIWAFGVIAYKFFHNTLPFVGTNNFEIFKSIKEHDPEISESIPLDIKQVIQACLRKNALERPTAQMLKNYSFFKHIKFSTIFYLEAPMTSDQIKHNSVQKQFASLSPTNKKSQNQELFSVVLEKRMFFGNYKPRILALYRKRGDLFFAYKYVDTKQIKNQIQINMNDYCQKISANQLQIRSDAKQYIFRCQQIQVIDKLVEEINDIIRQHYKLK